MTLYSFSAYLAYLWKARTRHGVHSPFVFDFIEQVLRGCHNDTFRKRLEQYFGAEHVRWIDDADTTGWEQVYLHTTAGRTELSVIIFTDVHTTTAHTKTWQSLYSSPEVRLSIDLYRYGLLFYRDEFREKQHFILRYPA